MNKYLFSLPTFLAFGGPTFPSRGNRGFAPPPYGEFALLASEDLKFCFLPLYRLAPTTYFVKGVFLYALWIPVTDVAIREFFPLPLGEGRVRGGEN